MESLPSEIINEILLLVDKPSLYCAAQVCKEWRQLSLKQVAPVESESGLRSTCRKGDHLSVIKSKINKSWLNSALIAACQGGHEVLANLLISKGADNWDAGFANACLGGHKELVYLMINKGDDCDQGLNTVCYNSNRETADLAIARSADGWNIGLIGSCYGGHKDLVELMIAKGACDWNGGLYGACIAGHKELIALMIAKGANSCSCGESIIEH